VSSRLLSHTSGDSATVKSLLELRVLCNSYHVILYAYSITITKVTKNVSKISQHCLPDQTLFGTGAHVASDMRDYCCACPRLACPASIMNFYDRNQYSLALWLTKYKRTIIIHLLPFTAVCKIPALLNDSCFARVPLLLKPLDPAIDILLMILLISRHSWL